MTDIVTELFAGHPLTRSPSERSPSAHTHSRAPSLANSTSASPSPEPTRRYSHRGVRTQEELAQQAVRTYNIFIGNLRTETTEADLRRHFAQCGRISSASVVKKADKRGKFYGFVNFETDNGQRRALERDGVCIRGTCVRVRPQKGELEGARTRRHTEVDPSRSLYVGNIPCWSKTRLQDALEEKTGPMQELRCRDGFAYLVYRGIAQAEEALEKLKDVILEGFHEPLFVEFARSPAEREAITAGSPVEEVERHRRTVFISNLPPDIGDGDLFANFARYGHVKSVYIPRNAQNTVKGYAFLEFVKRSQAHQASIGGPVQIRERLVQVRKSLIQNSDRRKSGGQTETSSAGNKRRPYTTTGFTTTSSESLGLASIFIHGGTGSPIGHASPRKPKRKRSNVITLDDVMAAGEGAKRRRLPATDTDVSLMNIMRAAFQAGAHSSPGLPAGTDALHSSLGGLPALLPSAATSWANPAVGIQNGLVQQTYAETYAKAFETYYKTLSAQTPNYGLVNPLFHSTPNPLTALNAAGITTTGYGPVQSVHGALHAGTGMPY